MEKKSKHRLPIPGLRNIKTALAVFLCLILYAFIGRTGVLLATIAVLICMQDSVEKSVEESISRIFGTAAGGAFGALYLVLMGPLENSLVNLICIPIGIVVLIYLLDLIKQNASIVIACVVYLIIILDDTVEEPVLYSINRILDTTLGILVALFVNQFFFRPKPERTQKKEGRERAKMGIPYKLIEQSEQKTTGWSGGTTTELLVYPSDSSYADRNFLWRISTATVDVQESDFTKLTGYTRHIMVLKGKMKLMHKGHYTVNLAPFEQDVFEGGWDTKSIGKCTDFNLMLAGKVQGELLPLKAGDTHMLAEADDHRDCPALMRTLYVLCDDVTLELSEESGPVLEKELTKGDFIIFDHLEMLEEKVSFQLSSQTNAGEVLAVSALVLECDSEA